MATTTYWRLERGQDVIRVRLEDDGAYTAWVTIKGTPHFRAHLTRRQAAAWWRRFSAITTQA